MCLYQHCLLNELVSDFKPVSKTPKIQKYILNVESRPKSTCCRKITTKHIVILHYDILGICMNTVCSFSKRTVL